MARCVAIIFFDVALMRDNLKYIAIHDGFLPEANWKNFLQGSDRIILDQHPYFAFGAIQPDPIAVPAADGQPGGVWPLEACNAWGPNSNDRLAI